MGRLRFSIQKKHFIGFQHGVFRNLIQNTPKSSKVRDNLEQYDYATPRLLILVQWHWLFLIFSSKNKFQKKN